MKKKYIVPESRLFALNLNENIAISGGASEISGSAVIKFTQIVDNCRGIYTGDESAPVNPNNSTFSDYYNELLNFGANVYFNCFRYQFG